MASIETELAELKAELRRLTAVAKGALPLLVPYREAARQLGLRSVPHFKARYVRTKRILVVKDEGGRPMVPAEELYRVVQELKDKASRRSDSPSRNETRTRSKRGSKDDAEAEFAKLSAALRKQRRR